MERMMAKRTVRLNKSHDNIVDETNIEDSVDMESFVKTMFKQGVIYEEAVQRFEALYLDDDPDGSIFDKTWDECESEIVRQAPTSIVNSRNM